MDINERLARIEAELRSLTRLVEKALCEQEEKNRIFSATRDKVITVEASARGAWWTIGLFGVLTTSVAAAVAWLVSYIRGA